MCVIRCARNPAHYQNVLRGRTEGQAGVDEVEALFIQATSPWSCRPPSSRHYSCEYQPYPPNGLNQAHIAPNLSRISKVNFDLTSILGPTLVAIPTLAPTQAPSL